MRLGKVIRAYRHHHEISMRALAKDIGVSAATLMRFEHGIAMDANTFLLILKWLTDKSAGVE